MIGHVPPRLGALSAVFLPSVASVAQAQAPEPPPRPFLRKVIQFTDAQSAAMERGDVVTKQVTTPEKAEIAAFSVVRIKGTRETLLQITGPRLLRPILGPFRADWLGRQAAAREIDLATGGLTAAVSTSPGVGRLEDRSLEHRLE